MEPVTIAIICALVFGGVVALSAFIRQLLLSRDKNLNDKAQQRALEKEVHELEKMRLQMESGKRFDSHYKVLGANKDAIVYLDTKIEEILQKKSKLVERYGQVTIRESCAIIDNGIVPDRKLACDHLKHEIDSELKFYDDELLELQKRRASLWDAHKQLEEHLLDQEKTRNLQLDAIYQKHTSVLEKIFLRHVDDSENVAKESIHAGTQTFKMMVLAPFQFLLQFFSLSKGISTDQFKKEMEDRAKVAEAEKEINGGEEEVYREEENVEEDVEKNPESEYAI